MLYVAACCWISLTKIRAVRKRMPFLCMHVANVVGLSSKKQVIRIHASGIVATVKHEQSNRNWSIGQFQCFPVRPHSASACFSEMSVACANERTSPQPARVGLVDELPKSLCFVRQLLANVALAGTETPIRSIADLAPKRSSTRVTRDCLRTFFLGCVSASARTVDSVVVLSSWSDYFTVALVA